ncbi:MAG: transposase [Kiritimatiellia bacterium]
MDQEAHNTAGSRRSSNFSGRIRRHREHILNTIRFGLSNARIEATNNKIKLLPRIAYGFRNIDTMISLVMLFCSSIEIPRPGRKRNAPTNTGGKMKLCSTD